MSDERPAQRNWRRRVIGAVVCVSPIAIAVASIVFGIVRGTALTSYGLYVVLLAAVVGVFNFWLSMRPLLYRLKHGSSEGYHHTSGIIIVATLAVVIGVLLSFGHIVTASLGLLVLLIDTGGLPWFLAVTWRDSRLWDEVPLR
ncbi:MAG TPA: hypothetical protein VEI07_13430 [Planctomycetaceae bacterium]|nr:hypothetical protein [Planctomycetaceae bacterium]